MANNYEQSTVNPTLPKSLFTDLELMTLTAFGMSHEPSHDDHLYFYSEESSWGDDIEIDHLTYTKILNSKENFVAKQYLDYIDANELHDNAEEDGLIINLEELNDDTDGNSELTVENIFKSILNKALCDVKEIVIEGAFTCDKLRQSEFGGFVTRITQDSIQHGGTQSMLQQMRHPETIRIAVVLDGGLVQAIVSDKPESLSVITIDYDTDGCDEEDITQVKQSDGSYSRAKCTNECISEPSINLNEVFGASNGSWIIRKTHADDKKSEEVRDAEQKMIDRTNTQQENGNG